MQPANKKDLKLEYKLGRRPMGVFRIRNRENDRSFVDSSMDVPGKVNRHKFQLNAGVHPSKSLQADWTRLGEAGFEFEILESVEPREDAGYDHAADVKFLEDLWLEKLEPYGENGYNEKKLTRDQRLQMIANRNRGV